MWFDSKVSLLIFYLDILFIDGSGVLKILLLHCCIFLLVGLLIFTFPGGLDGKVSVYSAGNLGSIPGQEDPWKRACQTTPVFLPGESPWTEEPGGLQSKGS